MQCCIPQHECIRFGKEKQKNSDVLCFRVTMNQESLIHASSVQRIGGHVFEKAWFYVFRYVGSSIIEVRAMRKASPRQSCEFIFKYLPCCLLLHFRLCTADTQREVMVYKGVSALQTKLSMKSVTCGRYRTKMLLRGYPNGDNKGYGICRVR